MTNATTHDLITIAAALPVLAHVRNNCNMYGTESYTQAINRCIIYGLNHVLKRSAAANQTTMVHVYAHTYSRYLTTL